MGLEANLVYLEEEIGNLQERISSIRHFLKANPSSSIYRRRIGGRLYYYKKFRQGNRSISEFLGNEAFDFKAALLKLKEEKEKIRLAKRRLLRIKKEIIVLRRQARIVRKAFEHVRV